MLRSRSFIRWFTAAGALLSAALAGASCAGNSAGDFVDACQKYCAAQAAPACAKGLPLESCKSQCSAGPAALGSNCADQYTAELDCVSGLEFTCVNDVPTPKTQSCLDQTNALLKCQESAPCQSYCDAAAAAGCAGGGDCVTSCRANVEKQQECGSALNEVLDCEAMEKLTCQNGKATTPLCVKEKSSYANCLSFDDPCSAFCYLADDAGCGGASSADCIMACQMELAAVPACKSVYGTYIDCAVEKGVTCDSGKATVPECTVQRQDYDDCVKMNMNP